MDIETASEIRGHWHLERLFEQLMAPDPIERDILLIEAKLAEARKEVSEAYQNSGSSPSLPPMSPGTSDPEIVTA